MTISRDNLPSDIPECGARISIYGDFDPVNISARIGVEPNDAYRKGDRMIRKKERQAAYYPASGWHIEVALRPTYDATEALLELLERVRPFEHRLLECTNALALKLEVVVVGYIYESVMPAMKFNEELIAWLFRMKATLEMDLLPCARTENSG